MTMAQKMPFMARLLWFIASPLIWFLHLALIYSLLGFGGAFGLTAPDVEFFGWISTVLAAAAVLFIIIQTRRRCGINDDGLDPMRHIANFLALLSLLAILLQMLAFWLVPYPG
jgi:hypothetical protein